MESEPLSSVPFPSPLPSIVSSTRTLDLTPEKSKKKNELKGNSSVRPLQAENITDMKLYKPHLLSTAKLYNEVHQYQPHSEDHKDIIHSHNVTGLNIPRHVSRYTNLTSVELSNESFEQISPNTKNVQNTKTTVNTEEPCINELFTDEYIHEDISWKMNAMPLSILDVHYYSTFRLYNSKY